MSNPNWIVADIDSYLSDCPPYDCEIDSSILPEVAQEISKRFDSTAIYDQIDRLCCAILRERGINPSADDLEPEPGPTYAVWFAEQGQVDSAPGGHFPGPWTWTHDQNFTCDDDPDGRGARRSAHEYARHLRSTYPCAYVAVLPAGKRPLPIRADG